MIGALLIWGYDSPVDRNSKTAYKRGAWIVLPVMLIVGCRVGLRACVSASRHRPDESTFTPVALPPPTPTPERPRPKQVVAADGFTSKEIATGQAMPDDLVLSASHVAWLRTRSGDVVVAPRAGGEAKTIAQNLTLVRRRHAQALALSATHAYWITNEGNENGRVMRAPLEGGATETLAEGIGGLTAIALDKDDVYFGVHHPAMNDDDAGVRSGVYRIRPGKKPVPVFEGVAPCGIAIDDKTIYVIEELGLTRIPKTGHQLGQKQIVPATERLGCSVVVDDENVYWTVPSSDLFMRAKKTTGAEVASTKVRKRPWNVVVDGGYAYVLTELSSDSFGELGSIYKIAVRASATSETALPKAIVVDRVGLNGLAANGGSIFFTAWNESETDGTVVAVTEALPK